MKKFTIILFLIPFTFLKAQWIQQGSAIGNYSCGALAVNGTDCYVSGGPINQGCIWKSTDNGNNWSVVNFGQYYTWVSSFAFIGSNIFAGVNSSGTAQGGVKLSTDNGLTWNYVNTGLPGTFGVLSLSVIGTTIFAGVFNHGVYMSTNNGANWNPCTSFPTGTNVYSFGVAGTDIFAGTDNGIYISTDIGNSWSPAGTGIPWFAPVKSFLISGSNIFAGSEENVSPGGVFLTTNNGGNWSPMNSGITSHSAISLVQNSSEIFTVVPGINGSVVMDSVYLSTNNGSSWKSVNSGLPVDLNLSYGVHLSNLAISGPNILLSTSKGIWRRQLSEFSTGIENLNLSYENVDISPNPFTSRTSVIFNSEQRNTTINIMDIFGVLIKTVNFNGREYIIEKGDMQSGIYFVQVTDTKRNVFTKKLLVE